MKDNEKELMEPRINEEEDHIVIEKVDVLDQGIQRFAVSGLSKDRADEAVKEEILLEKNIGDFLMMNKDGIIMSADNINRNVAAFNSAVNLAEQTGICGDIYLVEDDGMTMPYDISFRSNLLGDNPIEIPEGYGKFLLNFDYNEYVYNTDTKYPDKLDFESEIQLTFTVGTHTKVAKLKVNEMNRYVFSCKTLGLTLDTPIRITKIIFMQHDSYIGNKGMKGILHNLFITVNKEVE